MKIMHLIVGIIVLLSVLLVGCVKDNNVANPVPETPEDVILIIPQGSRLPSADEELRMKANGKILLENLPMIPRDRLINENDYLNNLYYTLETLEQMKIGYITEIEVSYAPAKPGYYGEKERVEVKLSDDCGNMFEMQMDLFGHNYHIMKIGYDNTLLNQAQIGPTP